MRLPNGKTISGKLLSAALAVVLVAGTCPTLCWAAIDGESGHALSTAQAAQNGGGGNGEGSSILPSEGSVFVAQSSANIAEGISGTCTWTIDAGGKLTVSPVSGGEGELENWDDQRMPPWHDYCKQITACRFTGTVKTQTCYDMFHGCSSLASLDLSGLDMSKATDMIGMFAHCSSLASLDLTPLDTSKVTTMTMMFSGCSSLASLDLTPLDTSSVAGMDLMFHGCSSLTSLDLTPLDTSSVTAMEDMFSGCSSLTSLDLSGLDTSKVAYMNDMFWHCPALSTLDLSSFDTSGVKEMMNMFGGCSSLETVYVSGLWSTAAVVFSYGMFKDALKIVGANGTVYDAAHTDAEYARVDRAEAPGYFMSITDKGKEKGKTSIVGAKVAGLVNKSYTGDAVTQSPTVTLGSNTLKNGVDYALSYANNVNVGSATVYVAGVGKYKGVAKATFLITKATNTLKVTPKTAKVSKSKKTKTIKRAKVLAVSKAQGTVTYKKLSGNKKITINSKRGNVKLRGGLQKNTYKVKVRVTAAGNSEYNSGSRTVTFKVRIR